MSDSNTSRVSGLTTEGCLSIVIVLVLIIFLLCLLIVAMITFYYFKLSRRSKEVIYIPAYITTPVSDLPSSSSSSSKTGSTIKATNSPPLSSLLFRETRFRRKELTDQNKEDGKDLLRPHSVPDSQAIREQKHQVLGIMQPVQSNTQQKTAVKSGDVKFETFMNSAKLDQRTFRSESNLMKSNEPVLVKRKPSVVIADVQTVVERSSGGQPAERIATHTEGLEGSARFQVVRENTSWYTFDSSKPPRTSLRERHLNIEEPPVKRSKSSESEQYDMQTILSNKSNYALKFKPIDDETPTESTSQAQGRPVPFEQVRKRDKGKTEKSRRTVSRPLFYKDHFMQDF